MGRGGRPNQPMRDVIIEGLSTGMVTRSVDKIDDFDGTLIPIDPKSVPKAGDLKRLEHERRVQAMTVQATATQRITSALNQALSTGMPSQFASTSHKPFKRRI